MWAPHYSKECLRTKKATARSGEDGPSQVGPDADDPLTFESQTSFRNPPLPAVLGAYRIDPAAFGHAPSNTVSVVLACTVVLVFLPAASTNKGTGELGRLGLGMTVTRWPSEKKWAGDIGHRGEDFGAGVAGATMTGGAGAGAAGDEEPISTNSGGGIVGA